MLTSAMGRLYLGTSGWAYPEWRGSFYSPGLPTGSMLRAYAAVFRTVEVNNTFYRMPSSESVAAWCQQVPVEFQFAFKAHRAITHRKRFVESTEIVDRFAELARGVGPRLGPVLFQFETLADVPQLADFLEIVRVRFHRVVVEFRHASWLSDRTYAALEAAGVAMCRTETDEGIDPDVRAGAFSYLRLRKSEYTASLVEQRAAALSELASGEHDVFAYLRHDAINAVLLRDYLASGRGWC